MYKSSAVKKHVQWKAPFTCETLVFYCPIEKFIKAVLRKVFFLANIYYNLFTHDVSVPMFQYYNNDEVSGECCNYEARIGVRWNRNDIFVRKWMSAYSPPCYRRRNAGVEHSLLEQLTLFPNASIVLEDAYTHRSNFRPESENAGT